MNLIVMEIKGRFAIPESVGVGRAVGESIHVLVVL